MIWHKRRSSGQFLREALGGATRTELWLAARTASTFVTEAQFRLVIAELVGNGDLNEDQRHWTMTSAGRDRLARLQRHGLKRKPVG